MRKEDALFCSANNCITCRNIVALHQSYIIRADE